MKTRIFSALSAAQLAGICLATFAKVIQTVVLPCGF